MIKLNNVFHIFLQLNNINIFNLFINNFINYKYLVNKKTRNNFSNLSTKTI